MDPPRDAGGRVRGQLRVRHAQHAASGRERRRGSEWIADGLERKRVMGASHGTQSRSLRRLGRDPGNACIRVVEDPRGGLDLDCGERRHSLGLYLGRIP
jgi:hypothetical protein